MKLTLKTKLLALSLLIITLLITACYQRKTPPSATDIISQYQSKVGYTIVLPDYLPPHALPGSYGVQGTTIGTNSTEFSINYIDGLLRGYSIEIYEVGEFKELNPAHASYKYLDFSSFQVLEEMYKKNDSNTDQSTLEIYSYKWNQSGVYFLVRMYGYQQDERYKFIESFVNQQINP